MPKFRILYRIALRRSYRAGLLTSDEYTTAMAPLRRRPHLRRGEVEVVDLIGEVQDYVYSQMGYQGFGIDFLTIIQWIKDNWALILRFILAILIFVEPSPEES